MQLVALHLRTRSIDSTIRRRRARGRQAPRSTPVEPHDTEIIDRLRAEIGGEAELRTARSSTDPVVADADLLAIVSASDVPWHRIRSIAVGADVPLLVVVDRWDDEDEWKALERGAMGYVALDLAPAVLSRSLRAALRGEMVFRRRTLGRWLRPSLVQPTRLPGLSKLTSRQREVASLLTTGAADKEIAVRLGIGVATVQKHVSKLLRTIGASNRAAAVWLVLGGTHIADQ